ncbi:response regulator [Arcticibacter sp. MXS-1]|uniref:response regulator n=1 Tax=Arcticibacter sp. MXS-1 TaxID=3341726 RepID=UPI0035A931BB
MKNAGPEHAVLLFQVMDTGIGISKEKIPFLFNSFTQGDSSTTRKYGGTGLGLAISERLVNLMGGHIEVESEPERGASFRFSIFCRLSARTERPGLKEPENGEGRENYIGPREEHYGEDSAAEPEDRLTILLAEDNAVNQKLVQLMLTRLDLNADIAWNGVEAVKLYKAKRHDLVLMDILMPEMDGLEATWQIRASYDGESRPFIVVLTADATQRDKENCLQAGMDEYLAKPFKREDFVAIIRSAALVAGKAEQDTQTT